jgi:enolase
MTIEKITVREIFDSRGDRTIEVGVREGGFSSSATIPSGKSRGSREAAVLSPGAARDIVESRVAASLAGKTFGSVAALDRALIELDGTQNKSVLGGNLILGLSVAHARNLAAERREELWQVLASEFFPDTAEPPTPVIFANLINGGAHAPNNLSIQEYLVLAATTTSVTETVEALIALYRAVGADITKRYGLRAIPIGDENGYAPNFKDGLEPLALLGEVMHSQGVAGNWRLGLDVAASAFLKDGRYEFEEKGRTAEELILRYGEYLASVPGLVSLEDPFSESDPAGFAAFRTRFPDLLVVGDDLTVTSPALIEQYAGEGCISGVIIKPNQIGSLSEACAAMRAAHAHGVKTIVSHRSGETEDAFIIHLARAGGAYGVKIGAPLKERISKYDELIRLYEK